MCHPDPEGGLLESGVPDKENAREVTVALSASGPKQQQEEKKNCGRQFWIYLHGTILAILQGLGDLSFVAISQYVSNPIPDSS